MKRLGSIIGLSALIATAVVAQAQAESLTKIRVAYDGFSMTTGPMNYAAQKGIFKKFGLDVTPTYVQGGSTLTQAVVGGSVDIAQNGYTPAISAAIQGADVVLIGGISNKLPFQLVTKASVTGAEQLKGQAIAISRYGSSTDTAAEFAVKHLGLTTKDVKILQLGGPTNRIAALTSGQIAGTMEQYPDTGELVQKGYRVLVDVTPIAGDYPNTAYVSSRAYVKSHSDAVKKFMKAMATAIHEYKTHPDEAMALTAKFLSVKDPAIMKAAYEAYTKIYPDIPRPSLQGIEIVLKQMGKKNPKAAATKPEQLVDTSTLDGLEREGFFKSLTH
jgi:NitT/TauT family transport system substrate-binding protein